MSDETMKGFRTSPLQQRCWELQKQSTAYHIQFALLLEGNLDRQALDAALQTIINDHEILRTHFALRPAMTIPIQIVSDQQTLYIQDIACTGQSEQEQQALVQNFFLRERAAPLAQVQAPLCHFGLAMLSLQRHLLLVSLPALCADIATCQTFMLAFKHAYKAGSVDKAASAETLQYADLSEWLHELLETEDADAGRTYWIQKNNDPFQQYLLPFESVTDTSTTFTPHDHTIALPPATLTRITALLDQYDVTQEAFLLTCWQILCWRLNGRTEIGIGNACDERKHEALQQTLGLLTRYVPFYNALEAGRSFIETVRQSQIHLDENRQWQEYFSWENAGDRDSFFPCLFDYTSIPTQQLAGELSCSFYSGYICLDKFKLRLSCIERNNDLLLTFYYHAGVFLDEDISRLAQYFSTLVENVVENAETPVDQLHIQSEAEQLHILIDFNATEMHYPPIASLHTLFEQQVEQRPTALAVTSGHVHLTYQDLNQRANQIAHYLRALGVGPDIPVGICIERSAEMLIGVLGILKAGGAYVPIDLTLPALRCRSMLQQAKISLLLTQQAFAPVIESLDLGDLHAVFLDRERQLITQQPLENPQIPLTPAHLAYVIYTSGSTGQPKGVAIEHHSLLNYVQFLRQHLDLRPGLHYATVSTLSADLGNTVIFSSLICGGCLHVLPYDLVTSGERFTAYMRQHPIDVLKIVPSHIEALLESTSAPTHVLPRRFLLLGGEIFSLALYERLTALAPTCQILNHYGLTETTIGVLTFATERLRDQPRTIHTMPLGHPIANTQAYILDEQLQPLPIGGCGELFISGASLARGYIGQDTLTAERFITHPFIPLKGERLYRTGDMARFLPDGTIEFLGRRDQQVKIRGYRVELAEIEQRLRQFPAIRDAVLLARADADNNLQLVAYIVIKNEPSGKITEPSSRELRDFLQNYLPEYMLPAHFIRIDTIPLTNNGKLDRHALPPINENRLQASSTFTAPRTEREMQLAHIWAELLELEQVGIHDDFFELGGDSLLIILIIQHANKLGIQLTVQMFYKYKTIAEIAARL